MIQEERKRIDDLFADIERRQALVEQRGLYLTQRREEFEKHLQQKESEMRETMKRGLKDEMYAEGRKLLQQMEAETIAKQRLAKERQEEIAKRELELQQAEDRWEMEKQEMEQVCIERLRKEYETERNKRGASGGARPKELKQERVDIAEHQPDIDLQGRAPAQLNRKENRVKNRHEEHYSEVPQRDMKYKLPSTPAHDLYSEPQKRQLDRGGTDKLTQKATGHLNNAEVQLDERLVDMSIQKERDTAATFEKRQGTCTRKSSEGKTQASTQGHVVDEHREVPVAQNVVPDNTPVIDSFNTKPPFIGLFSGIEPRPRNESSFEDWKLEVDSLMATKVYSDIALTQAIRKSLRVPAKRVLLPLGPTTIPMEIVNRLQSVFGYVASCDAVLEEFYTAEQGQDESVADWGIRLEDILQKAIDKGHVIDTGKNETLRRKFWRSLYSQELKNATTIHFETIKDFEILRQKVREEEYEINASDSKRSTDTKRKPGKTATQHQPVFKDNDDQMTILKSLMEQMKTMNKDMQELKEKDKPHQQYYDYNNRGRGRGRRGQQQDQTSNRGRGRGRRGQHYEDRQANMKTDRDKTVKKVDEKEETDQLNQ